MAAIKLVQVVQDATATFSGNPQVGDIYLDPSTGSDRLTNTLAEEVIQSIRTRFLFFKGEWFLDTSAGVPWFQSILGIKNSSENVTAILKQVITKTAGVSSLTSFALNQVGRTISPKFTCLLADGTVLQSGDFGPMVIGG